MLTRTLHYKLLRNGEGAPLEAFSPTYWKGTLEFLIGQLFPGISSLVERKLTWRFSSSMEVVLHSEGKYDENSFPG
jgi:hypothetical protein